MFGLVGGLCYLVAAVEIVIPTSSTEVERSAAKELRACVAKMTGETLQIVREKLASPSACHIYIGATKIAERTFGNGGWRPDEIAIKSIDDGLVLTGEATRGPIYAVDTYLEEICGVRWWTATESFYPSLKVLPVTNVDLRHASPFKYRETYYLGALDPWFKVRLKGNFTSKTKCQAYQPGRIPADWGGDSTMHYFETRASAYHSVLQILPPAKYYADHPDWYVVPEGKKDPRQLCLTNPHMREAFIAELDALLAAHPETDFVQISQEDTSLVCSCDACRAVEAEEGAASGVYLRFVNAVAAALEAKHPHVTFDTFAYRFTRKPPKFARPRHNVTVRLCDIECAFNVPLSEMDANGEFLADLEGWSRIAAGRLYIWDYVTDFTSSLLPHSNLAALAPNIRLFAKSGAVGVFEQGDSVCCASSLAPYRTWMLAHLLWNPAADENKLREDFLTGYYGPRAAPYVRTFLDNLDQAGRDAAKQGIGVTCYHANVTSFWMKAEALAACAALDEAFEAARADGDVYARRIDRERLSTDLVRLLNWKIWGLGSEPERLALFRSWHAKCRAYGVKAYREAYGAADFEACAAALRRGIEPSAANGVPKPKAPGKPGFVWPKPFPTRNLQAHSSFEAGFRPHGVNVALPFGADMVQPSVTVDETTAVHGRRSLRLDNTKTGGELQLQMAETEVAGEREPFVVSAYVKADRPTKVRLGVERLQFDSLSSGSLLKRRVFEIGTEWQRIELPSITVDAPVSGFHVHLTVASDSVVWVDAVQVEPCAGAATPYAPSAPIEAAFEVDERVRSREDDVSVECGATLRACTYLDEAQAVNFSTDAGAFELLVEPGGIAKRHVNLKVERNGRVTFGGTFATATHGVTGVVSPDETAVAAAVPPVPVEGFRIGANGILGLTFVKRPEPGFSRFREAEKVWRGPLGYSLDDYYRDLRRGGYSIARFHDGAFAWEDVEREKGVFDWSKMDVIEAGLRKNGLDPMFVFASHGVFRTKAHGDGNETNWFVRVNSRRGGLGVMSKGKKRERLVYYHPRDTDWTDWVTAVVSRYHKTIRYWEIVNEPNGTVESAAAYAHYAELCYKAVKAIDLDSVVLGVCSTGDLGLDAASFFREAGEAGAFKWLDAASFHPYQQPLDVPGKDGEKALGNLRQICDKYRLGVPLWDTEVYYINAFTSEQTESFKRYRKNPKDPTARPRPDAARLRSWPAGNLIKRYAIDLGGNCVASTPLQRDQHLAMGAGRETSELELGVIGIPPVFAVNDRYFANAAFARYLEGAKFLCKPDLPNGFNGFVFRDRHGQMVALVWRRPGEDPASLRCPVGAVVRDLYGNRITRAAIDISAEPVYFFLTDDKSMAFAK